jgi:hypothetical protein
MGARPYAARWGTGFPTLILVVSALLAVALPAAAQADPAATMPRTITSRALQAQEGGAATVARYQEPPVASAAGAAGREEEPNTGRNPPVAPSQGGLPGGGLGEASVIPAPGAQGDEDPDDLVFLAEPAVVTTTADYIAEPQVGRKGERMLVTWNYGAAQSWDGGQTFSYLDPFSAFPWAGDGFCCDQLVAHIPAHDLWVWVLQYLRSPGPTGENLLRVAVAAGDEAFDAPMFDYWDFTAQGFDLPGGQMLDLPKLGWTDDALVLSINAYQPEEPDGDGTFEASIVWRMPIEGLLAGDLSGVRYFTTLDYTDAYGWPLFNPFPLRGSGDTMVLASHVDDSTLGIWTWPDDSDDIGFRTVTSRLPSGDPLAFPSGSYDCPMRDAADPEASDWCTFNDPRIRGGWRSGDRVGFAWNVPQAPGWEVDYPWVFATELDLATIDACDDGGCVTDHPSVYLVDRAVQYLAVAPDASGDLGGVALAGGGDYPIQCLGLVRDADAAPGAGWSPVLVADSDAESPAARSGDYLGITPLGADAGAWTATCMTQHAPGGWTETHVHLASFGRRYDNGE